MAEEAQPEAEEAPAGPIRHGKFAGILEGHRGDVGALHDAVAELNALGLVLAELNVEGGRFDVLFSEERLPGDRFTPEKVGAFVEHLQRLVDAAAEPATVESTLRCVEVYGTEAVETLFAVRAGKLEILSQRRPLRPSDLPPPVSSGLDRELSRFGMRRALVLLGGVLVLFAALLWRSDLLGRAFGTEASSLALDTGPFAGLLAMEVEPHWGNYQLTLRRGGSYPATGEEVGALEGAAATPLARAAVSAVADGDGIFARLIDADGKVLAVAMVDLRPLLADADRSTTARLPGHIGARALELALDRGDDDE